MLRLLIVFFTLAQMIHVGYAQTDSELESARIPPRTVLERVQKAFNELHDMQTTLKQIVRKPSGEYEQVWASVALVKTGTSEETMQASMLLKIYDQPIHDDDFVIQSFQNSDKKESAPQPKKIVFTDQSRRLFTYETEANALTIEWLNESGPLPEFMQLAGFLELDLDQLEEKVYLDDDVYRQTIDSLSCYRVRMVPKKRLSEVEPDRIIWVDRETNLPKQLTIEGDLRIIVEFGDYELNKGISQESIIPEIPANPQITDLTVQ